MPNVIKVQKIPRPKVTPEDLLATFCYYYPAYTFDKARKVPYKRIQQMLKIAKKEQARKMLDLVQIVAAPHTKKGALIKSLTEKYSVIINE